MFIQFTRDYVSGSGRLFQGGDVFDLEKAWATQLINDGAATLWTSGDPKAAQLVADPLTGKVRGLFAPDGTTLPFNGLLAQQNTQTTAPLDTAENTLFSTTIPAGSLGPNGKVVVTLLGSMTNSANSKTIKIKFGGSDIAVSSYTASAVFKTETTFANRNSEAAQIMAGSSSGLSVAPNGGSTVAVTALAIDTTQAQTLIVTGQKASGAESLTLESVQVELIRGA